LTRNNISMLILFLGGLLLTHIYILEPALMVNEDKNIISITWENFVNYINGSSIGMKTAGGFTGAILLTLTFYLFSGIGAKIVGYFMIIIAILIVTNLSIGDLLQTMYQWSSQLMKKIKNEFSKKETSKRKVTICKKKRSEEKPIGAAVHFAYEEENHEQLTLPINDEKEEGEFTPVIQTETDSSNYILPTLALL